MAEQGILATFGIDDRPASRALSRVEGRAKGSVGLVEREMARAGQSLTKTFMGVGEIGAKAFGAVGTAAGIAVRLIRDFARENDYARQQVMGVDAAISQMKANIGRDMAAGGVGFSIAGAIQTAEAWRQGAVDWVARRFGASQADLDAVTQTDRVTREQNAQMRFRGERDRIGADIADASGLSDLAALRRINAEHASRVASINAMDGLSGSQRSELVRLEEQRRDEARARIVRESARAASEEQGKAAETIKSQRQSVAEEQRRYELQTMRLRGLDKEADRAEAELEAAKRIREIEGLRISDKEKADAISAVRGQLDERLAALDGGRSRLRRGSVLAAGLGSDQNIRQVFGQGPATTAALTETKKQTTLLAQIRDAVRDRNPAAVFAP